MRLRSDVSPRARAGAGLELAATLVAAAVLAALVVVAARDGDAEGIGGLLRFREDGGGVEAVGLVLLAGFFATATLLLGAWASGGRPADVAQ